mmetsp:Transcript_56468/g.132252  ORF Transcript_56468/g.132252 Transcript_56468/m.132252 type:complete len:214 (-) Transcript_56468:1559-2200(-)
MVARVVVGHEFALALFVPPELEKQLALLVGEPLLWRGLAPREELRLVVGPVKLLVLRMHARDPLARQRHRAVHPVPLVAIPVVGFLDPPRKHLGVQRRELAGRARHGRPPELPSGCFRRFILLLVRIQPGRDRLFSPSLRAVLVLLLQESLFDRFQIQGGCFVRAALEFPRELSNALEVCSGFFVFPALPPRLALVIDELPWIRPRNDRNLLV